MSEQQIQQKIQILSEIIDRMIPYMVAGATQYIGLSAQEIVALPLDPVYLDLIGQQMVLEKELESVIGDEVYSRVIDYNSQLAAFNAVPSYVERFKQ